MSSPPFGRLWVPKRSLTDWDNCAAFAPVNEKLRYCGFCCCCSCSAKMKKSHSHVKVINHRTPPLTNCIKLTLLEVCLCTTGHFQFARTWHCRNNRSTTREHCICLHFGGRWASIRPLNVAEILRNAFRSTRALCGRCAPSRVTWRWSLIFSTRGWTRRLSSKINHEGQKTLQIILRAFTLTCWLPQ